jgi:uroporphyrinogen decarboxylase
MPGFEFIRAAYGQPHSTVPIWIMRQAGRYLPEFRAVRDKASFTEICRTPELMAEVTMQPIDKFGFDAAIMFSDILLPLEPFGFSVSYENGGPHITPAIEEPEQINHLGTYEPIDEMAFALAGIKKIKERLNDQVPLIGFCGAPFTLASYLIEAGPSMRFARVKRFMYTHPKPFLNLLEILAEVTGRYLKDQIDHGVDAVQLFDSWGGILSPEMYRNFSLPFIKTVFDICRTEGIPRILYVYNSAPYLPMLADVDCEVVGIDWRTELDLALSILDGKSVQGNLDPHTLMGTPELIVSETARILDTAAAHDNFIFNLGHGIQPETPVENVRLLVETVHAFKRSNEIYHPDPHEPFA